MNFFSRLNFWLPDKCQWMLHPKELHSWKSKSCHRAKFVNFWDFLETDLFLQNTSATWLSPMACLWSWVASKICLSIRVTQSNSPEYLRLCTHHCNVCQYFRGISCLFEIYRSTQTCQIPKAPANWHFSERNQCAWPRLQVDLKSWLRNTKCLGLPNGWPVWYNKTYGLSLLICHQRRWLGRLDRALTTVQFRVSKRGKGSRG